MIANLPMIIVIPVRGRFVLKTLNAITVVHRHVALELALKSARMVRMGALERMAYKAVGVL